MRLTKILLDFGIHSRFAQNIVVEPALIVIVAQTDLKKIISFSVPWKGMISNGCRKFRVLRGCLNSGEDTEVRT